MSFAAPWMLWALPAAALPVVIHLLRRRRFDRVPWAAMEFLRRAARRTRRRVLLEDLLLLTLRTAAVLLAVLALARPGAEEVPKLLTGAAHSEILVLDASLSMRHAAGGVSAFERARDRAAELLDESVAAEGGRAALVTAGLVAERRAAGDPGEVRAALLELSEAGFGRGDLAGALEAARRTAEGFLDGPPPRVTVFTDLQTAAWAGESEVFPALQRLTAMGVAVDLVDVGAPVRDNVAVVEWSASRRRLVRGDVLELTARVRNFGDRETAVVGEAYLDGDRFARRSEPLAPDASVEWTFSVSPEAAGLRAVELRIGHDALLADDARALVVEVVEAVPVVLVGEPARPGHPPTVADSLAGFLDLGEDAPLGVAQVRPGRLSARDLEDADVVVLADPGPLDAPAVEALIRFLGRGGGVLVALGPETGALELEPLLRALDVTVEIGSPLATEAPHARLAIADPDHPALRFFTDPRWRPLLTEVPIRTFRPLRPDPADASARVVLRFRREGAPDDEAEAALVEVTPPGGGRLVLYGAPPDPRWNRFEEVPGGTLPFLFDLVFALTPPPTVPAAVEVGAPLEARLTRPPTEVVLRDPDGTAFPVRTELAVTEEGERIRLRALDRASRPGVWRADARLLEPDGSELERALRWAVVTPPAESDLRPVLPAVLAERLPDGVRVVGSGGDDGAESPPPQLRADLSLLLWRVVLVLFGAETLLAAFLDRRRRR